MRTDITTRAILTNRYGEDNRGKAFAQSSNTFMSCGVKSPSRISETRNLVDFIWRKL